MTPEEFDLFTKLKDRLRDAEYQAHLLAQQMNGVVHDNLTEQAESLEFSLADTRDLVETLSNSILNITMKQAQQSTTDVLKAALGGVELANRGHVRFSRRKK